MRDPAMSDASRSARRLAGTYAVFGIIWIFASSWIAANLSASVQAMRGIEIAKGSGFIFLSTALLYLVSRRLFLRIGEAERRIAAQREALELAEGRAYSASFAGALLHDINNYLMIGIHAAENLSRSDDLGDDERQWVEAVLEHGRMIHDLSKRFQAIGRCELSIVFEEVDVEAFVAQIIRFMRHHPRVRGCELVTSGTCRRPLRASKTLLQQILTNLIVNAAEALGNQGKIEVEMREGKEHLTLAVHDSGEGVPVEDRATIFSLFVSRREGGIGIGLASVKACVESHGGEIEVGDSKLGGACFCLRLPFPEIRAVGPGLRPNGQSHPPEPVLPASL